MATTSPFKQQCPGCGTAILIKDPKNIGKRAACPKCHNKFVIEDPSAAEVPVEVVEDTPKPAAKTQPAAKPAAAPLPAEEPPIEAEADEPAPRGFSSFKTMCPSCDAPITIKDPAQISKKIECPRCKYRFQVEAPRGAGPAAEPAKKPKKRARFDDEDDKPKPKVASNNLVLILGVGLAVLALGLLGVGGYFILFHGQDPESTRTTQVVQTSAPVTRTAPSTATKVEPAGPVLPEITNLLPNNSDLVVHIHVKELNNSIVGRAAFNSPGTFKVEQVAKDLGLAPDEVEAIAVGGHTGKDTGLAAIRTTKDIDLEKLKAALSLEPASDSPYKRQDYFVGRPSAWLAGLRRMSGDAKTDDKPIRPAVRAVDKRTLVVGDLETLKEFLEVSGQFKALTPADPKSTSNRFLTVDPVLKGLMDRLEARSPMISVASIQGAQAQIVKGLEAQVPAKLSTLEEFLHGTTNLGVALNLHDGVVLTFAGDLKDPTLAKKIDAELTKFCEGFAQLGLTTEINKHTYQPARKPSGQEPVRRLIFRTNLTGTRSVIETQLELNLSGNQFLFNYFLHPAMQVWHGMAEMANSRPRIFELAGALKAYTEKNQKLPRGTLPRKAGKLGIATPPDQRLSWLVELLPFVGYEEVYKGLQLGASWRPEYDRAAKPPRLIDENTRLARVLVPAFLDPETSSHEWWLDLASLPGYRCAGTHFVGVAGIGLESADLPKDDPTVTAKLGVFGYDRDTALADIKDGPAATIAILQVPPTYGRPWIAGGGATVTGVPESASIKPFVCKEYQKEKGTFAIMADGSVRFIPETISDEAFKALCTIAGGEKVDLDKETRLVPSPSGKSELKTVTQN